MDHDAIDSMFEFVPQVDEQIENTSDLEKLGELAARFGHGLVDLLPNTRARREAITKLVTVVDSAAASIRDAAARKDRAIALSKKADSAEAQHA